METENKTTHFCGNPISTYGIEKGFVDFYCFSQAFNHIQVNQLFYEIIKTFDYEILQGETENEDGENIDIYQYFLIDGNGEDFIKRYLPNEILFYFEELDLTIWGITHFGTSWTGVLTDLKISDI